MIWLIGQSIFVLGTLCPWCMLVWLVTIPLFWVVTLRNAREGVFGSRLTGLGSVADALGGPHHRRLLPDRRGAGAGATRPDPQPLLTLPDARPVLSRASNRLDRLRSPNLEAADVPEERQTKNQRREAAREAARLEREKQKRRDRLRRWLIPTVSTVAVLAIAAAIVWAFVSNQPAPQSVAGPRNMISDGILFTGEDGRGDARRDRRHQAVRRARRRPTSKTTASRTSSPTSTSRARPASRSRRRTRTSIQSLVASGLATLEVHPIAILDSRFVGSRYSSRANNVGACVADLAPESFLDVMAAMFTNQPAEGTTGLSDAEIIDVVHGAGLVNDDVDACIEDELFGPWVTAATERTTSDPDLVAPGAEGFSTPTIVVNGEVWDRTIDVMDFIQSKISRRRRRPGTD